MSEANRNIDTNSASDTTSGETEAQTHFGFETVSGSEKVNRVMGVFSSVASQYDI